MECRIDKLSNYGEKILNGGCFGTVHSVYRTAVNLSLGGRMAALQPAGSPMSPVSLITNLAEREFDRLGIESGRRVRIAEDSVIMESEKEPDGFLRFSFGKAVRKDLKLAKPLPAPLLTALAVCLEKKLLEDPAEGFRIVLLSNEDDTRPAPASLLAEAVKRLTDEAAELFGKKAWAEAVDSLCRLIGLGTGLTPGGDDFLCGALAGMAFAGYGAHPFTDCLKSGIRANLDRTNDISRMFLICALEDQFGTAVHRFYEGKAEKILDGMEQIGHTSGIDTLCGILYAFRIVGRSGTKAEAGLRQKRD